MTDNQKISDPLLLPGDIIPLRARSEKVKSRTWDAIGSILLFVVSLAAWGLVSTRVPSVILPGPREVLGALWQSIASGDLWKNLVVTLAEIILGFALGTLFGVGCGALLAEWGRARRILMPYLVVTQAVPKFALAPIFVLWFGFGLLPKMLITALIAFFPLLENTIVGLASYDPDALKLFRSLRASRWQIFTKLALPSALPYILAGVRVAMVFSIVGAIVAEYVGANVGLGAMIIVAQGTMDTPLMFAVFVVTTLLGLFLYQLVVWAEALFMRRRHAK